MLRYHIENVFPTGPGIKEWIAQTPTTYVFDGYFRIEPELPTHFPLRRLMYNDTDAALIQITGIQRGNNTSTYFYDSEEKGMICLTPTELIELTYVVLESGLTEEQYREYQVELSLDEDNLRAANEELAVARYRTKP